MDWLEWQMQTKKWYKLPGWPRGEMRKRWEAGIMPYRAANEATKLRTRNIMYKVQLIERKQGTQNEQVIKSVNAFNAEQAKRIETQMDAELHDKLNYYIRIILSK